MKNTIITVGGVTYAMKLQRMLLRAGIRSAVVRVARGGGDSGCTHGVELSEENFYSAVALMRKNGIDYKVYSG